MSQILRISRPNNVLLLVRSYGNQRQTYYDVLGVPSNSTQKEIKQAFIKLSKEMHPDTSGKQSHADFVRINEAYSVLSKERSRQEYDVRLRYGDVSDYPGRNYRGSPHVQYRTYREWETRMAGGRWPPPPYRSPSPALITISIILIVISIVLQILFIESSLLDKRRRITEERLQRRYKNMKSAATGKTLDEQILSFEERVNAAKEK